MVIKKLSDTPDLNKLNRSNNKLSSISGTFDLLHVGHIEALQEASKLGDFLVVFLNSDNSVKKYKGPGRPINKKKDREKFLLSLRFVDYVVTFDDFKPKKELKKIKPDIFCQSEEWGEECIEKDILESYGGRIHLIKKNTPVSTTDIIRKIRKLNKIKIQKAIFLDRDGTINKDVGYLSETKNFNFLPGTLSGLKKLSNSEYKLIIITNQSGVGRGYFTEDKVEKIHNKMHKKLKDEGIKIDKIYYCPHKPEDRCVCRKPKTGLIKKALNDFNLNLKDSWVIGDKESDVRLGKEVNASTIFISDKFRKESPKHFKAKNLKQAADIILKGYENYKQ